jgi:Type II restriction endonuclease EcoO109I
MIDEIALDAEVGRLLGKLYGRRFAALEGLKLTKLLNKNPYLYRAVGLNDPAKLIEQMLMAFISSSDETIFGNEFFEPLALWSARASTGNLGDKRTVTVGGGAGQDIAIETATTYLAISVKSGKNIFNSQSDKGQSSEFDALRARMKKLGKQFQPVIGYGYGRKSAKKASSVEKLAGQKFWELLTGEEDFYLRIVCSIGQFSGNHGADYTVVFDNKRTQLLREFMINFVNPDGTINWNEISRFNSSSERAKRLQKTVP